MFDNIEFGVAPKDARTLAPSTRKLLETSFLALLDSGIDYRTRNVGCYTSGVDWDSFGLPDVCVLLLFLDIRFSMLTIFPGRL